jgi:hypothetical protein
MIILDDRDMEAKEGIHGAYASTNLSNKRADEPIINNNLKMVNNSKSKS